MSKINLFIKNNHSLNYNSFRISLQTVIVNLTDVEYDVILAEHLINLTTVDSLIIYANKFATT